jgi:hypothetical protein
MSDDFLHNVESERLYSGLAYAIFAAPGAAVVIWMVWRVAAWCLFQAAVVSAWVGRLPALVRLPVAVGLLLIAWPLLLLALVAWVLVRLFPGLGLAPGQTPRLFSRSTSRAFSHVFLFCLALPLVLVPMRYLAYRLEGPQILFWHWLLILVPIPVLAVWLIARLRQKDDDWRRGL